MMDANEFQLAIDYQILLTLWFIAGLFCSALLFWRK